MRNTKRVVTRNVIDMEKVDDNERRNDGETRERFRKRFVRATSFLDQKTRPLIAFYVLSFTVHGSVGVY